MIINEEIIETLIEKYKQFVGRNIGELFYLGAQYSVPIVAFLVNILVMRYIDPATLGSYQSIQIWAAYFAFLQIGVFNGLNRNLSYYKGAGRLTELNEAASTGFVFSIFISFISLLVVISLYFTSINDSTPEALYAFIILGLTSFTMPISVLFDTLYRTGQDFKKLGKLIIIDELVFASSSTFVIFFGYYGFILQNALKTIISVILKIAGKINAVQLKFSFRSLKEQINTGFPILLNSYLYSTFFIFDQFYIVRSFENVDLGNYNLARLVLLLIPIVPTSLTTILYPKASSLFGQSGDNRSVLKPFFFKALLVNVIILIPLIVFIYYSIGPLVTNFLPKYINGINFAELSAIGGVGFVYIGPSIILGVLKKNSLNLIFLLFLSLTTYGLYFIGLLKFQSIESLIWYKNIIFISYAFIMTFYIYWLISKKA